MESVRAGRDGPHRTAPQRFEIVVGDVGGTVTLQRFVLPARDQFSSPVQFERLSGPLNWNRQQGLYIYRAGRLVQWGGWNGVRGIDEHTKLARAALDFDTDLDSVFQHQRGQDAGDDSSAAPPDARAADQRAVRSS